MIIYFNNEVNHSLIYTLTEPYISHQERGLINTTTNSPIFKIEKYPGLLIVTDAEPLVRYYLEEAFNSLDQNDEINYDTIYNKIMPYVANSYSQRPGFPSDNLNRNICIIYKGITYKILNSGLLEHGTRDFVLSNSNLLDALVKNGIRLYGSLNYKDFMITMDNELNAINYRALSPYIVYDFNKDKIEIVGDNR